MKNFILFIASCCCYFANAQTGLPVLQKNYNHFPNIDPQWNTTSVYSALETADFDSHWSSLLNSLPAPNANWNGGTIDLGTHGTGWGDISWNGAISASPKPILVQLPSYGAPPSVGSCPMDNRFIVCSAFNNSSGTTNGQSDYTIAILAIQQMIKNIMASGKSTQDVFVIGKSQGGGTGMITAGLCPFVKDCFFSVPALAGFTGSSGVNGGFPGWPSDTISSYLDAVNHAKRYRNKISFSISYNDVVTWGRGQVTCAKNTQYETTIYHGNDGHGDNDWWTNGTTWLNGCLDNIVDNGLGLADSSVVVEQIEVNSNPKFRLFPNPVEQGSIIMFERPFTGKLNIYDSKGSMIAETKIVNRTQLLLFELVDETLPRGHFVLNLIDSKSSVSVPIIVK